MKLQRNGEFLPDGSASSVTKTEFLARKEQEAAELSQRMQKNQPMPVLKAGNAEKERGDLPMEQEYLPGDTPQQRLLDLMKEYKITQAELDSKIGVAESSISRFLNGTKNKLIIEQIISIA